MKKFFLSAAIRRLIKQNTAERYNTPYKEAASFLVLFTAAGNDKISEMRRFEKKLIADGKNVVFIYFLKSIEDSHDVGLDEGMVKYDIRDINFFGQLKNDSILKLLNKDFDFLLHVDKDQTLFTDIIIAKSKARCRVGNYVENKHFLYELMVKVDEKTNYDFFLEQMYRYTKSLN
ncbi:MAG: hypothetical protein JJU28_24910 [Cyclobacteriaceae bacterium]|nr:hypothetical protein [Cyclobacteriaceae bacterium]